MTPRPCPPYVRASAHVLSFRDDTSLSFLLIPVNHCVVSVWAYQQSSLTENSSLALGGSVTVA